MCGGSTIYRSVSYCLNIESPLECLDLLLSNLTETQIIDSGLRAGDWAAFKVMGTRVIGIDTREEKRDLCMRLGCEAFVDFSTTTDLVEGVRHISNGNGVDGVFVTATSKAAYDIAPKIANIGGRVMCVGMPPSGTAFAGDDPISLILRNIKIIGTLTGASKDTDDALTFAARGLLKPVDERCSVDQLPEAVERLRSGKVTGCCVIDFNV